MPARPAAGYQPRSANVIGPLFMGLWILFGFGYQTVWSRWRLQVDGVVISSIDTPSRGAPRYATHYRLRGADGHIVEYIAGGTDASLMRGMPVGTRFQKERGLLGYSVDGRWIAFPLGFYSVVLTAALGCLGWAAFQWWRWPSERRKTLNSYPRL